MFISLGDSLGFDVGLYVVGLNGGSLGRHFLEDFRMEKEVV